MESTLRNPFARIEDALVSRLSRLRVADRSDIRPEERLRSVRVHAAQAMAITC